MPAVGPAQALPDRLPTDDPAGEFSHEILPPEALPEDQIIEDPEGLDQTNNEDLWSVPDLDAIGRLVRENPSALGPLSIGTPDAGLLLNPQPLEESPLWYVRDPSEAYATDETVAFIATAVTEVERRYPGSPRVVIGDLSRNDGGRLNRHRSHQSGRDVDLGFYFLGREPQAFVRGAVRGKPQQMDVERTWALVRALVTMTDIERIFLDRAIQRVLDAHARSLGEDGAWLDSIFGRTSEKGIIQHERRHLDHLHVRFFNRRAQEMGRLAYPLLVQAGLVPGPTVSHRVSRGETIGSLSRRYGVSPASIRSANRLRGNSIRAGRRYVIPVKKVPAAGEPTVIPPRRLPRSAMASGASTPSPSVAETASDSSGVTAQD